MYGAKHAIKMWDDTKPKLRWYGHVMTKSER